MKICGWCGIRLSGWRRFFAQYCKVCAFHFTYDLPSSPCPKMSKLGQLPNPIPRH